MVRSALWRARQGTARERRWPPGRETATARGRLLATEFPETDPSDHAEDGVRHPHSDPWRNVSIIAERLSPDEAHVVDGKDSETCRDHHADTASRPAQPQRHAEEHEDQRRDGDGVLLLNLD